MKNHDQNLRTYYREQVVVFRKTKEAFGGLSNMAAGFPLLINNICIKTSEALYQACRFPHLPDVQRVIIQQNSPMSAKMKGKPYRKETRADWDDVRITIMRWCLRVKLAQNWKEFGQLLDLTGDLPIVEESKKDAFWGAKPINEEQLQGYNILGRLLMELREEYRGCNDNDTYIVNPPGIGSFLLMNSQVQPVAKPVTAPESNASPNSDDSNNANNSGTQLSLFSEDD